jgi:uncharacterized integral membrane protein (TIGR00698 family)
LNSIRNIIPGLLLTSLIALLSFYFSSFIPIGSVAIAILIGISVNNAFLNQTEFFKTGISFSEKQLLSSAIILLGASLNFNKVMLVPISSVIFIVCIIFISLLLCYLLGKIFGLNKNLPVLLGIGNGVCGSSAIAGASKILDADKNDVGVSIAIINALGAISIFILPYILINFFPHFTNEQSGFLIGSTVQAVGQVTATGFIVNQEVGEYATFIKMIRIIMLGPILLFLSFLIKNKSKNNQAGVFNIPYFITGFIIFSLLVTFNFIPESLLLIIQQLSKILLVIAMAGIGLNISFRSIFEFGFKSFAIAALAFSFQIVFTFVIVALCF